MRQKIIFVALTMIVIGLTLGAYFAGPIAVLWTLLTVCAIMAVGLILFGLWNLAGVINKKL